MYSHIFENGGTLFAGVGPNFMFNQSGKSKYGGESTKIEFGSNEGQMKPFKGGYQFSNGIALSTFLNLGPSNLSNEQGQTFKSMDAIGFLSDGCLAAVQEIIIKLI